MAFPGGKLVSNC